MGKITSIGCKLLILTADMIGMSITDFTSLSLWLWLWSLKEHFLLFFASCLIAGFFALFIIPKCHSNYSTQIYAFGIHYALSVFLSWQCSHRSKHLLTCGFLYKPIIVHATWGRTECFEVPGLHIGGSLPGIRF